MYYFLSFEGVKCIPHLAFKLTGCHSANAMSVNRSILFVNTRGKRKSKTQEGILVRSFLSHSYLLYIVLLARRRCAHYAYCIISLCLILFILAVVKLCKA